MRICLFLRNFWKLKPTEVRESTASCKTEWSKKFSYVCPPVNFFIDFIRYIRAIPSRGVHVVPYLQRNPLWAVITSNEFHLNPVFTRLHEFYPRIMTGRDSKDGVRKRMLALQLYTQRRIKTPLQDL